MLRADRPLNCSVLVANLVSCFVASVVTEHWLRSQKQSVCLACLGDAITIQYCLDKLTLVCSLCEQIRRDVCHGNERIMNQTRVAIPSGFGVASTPAISVRWLSMLKVGRVEIQPLGRKVEQRQLTQLLYGAHEVRKCLLLAKALTSIRNTLQASWELRCARCGLNCSSTRHRIIGHQEIGRKQLWLGINFEAQLS